MLEFARANAHNVGKDRTGSGKYDYYEYNAAEEQKLRYDKQLTKINTVLKIKDMADEPMRKLASFLGIVFYDELGQPKGLEGVRTELLMKADSQFKKQLKDMSEEINTSVYDQLSVIIAEWSNANSINLVMGKMEVIFNTDDIDATEQILEAIKEKGMYYTESVSGEVVEPTV